MVRRQKLRRTSAFAQLTKPGMNKYKKSKRTKAARSAAVRMMRQVAKQEIHKMAEDKEYKIGASNRVLYSYPSTATIPNNFNSQNIIDTSIAWANIAQGTGEGDRVGNKIKLTKFMFNFILNYNVAVNVPQFVRMWVVTYKFDPNNAATADIWSGLQTSNSNNFFDNGNTSNGMGGTLLDLVAPVNTNAWTVHKCKTYKIGAASAPSGGTTIGNNDFKYAIKTKVNLLKYQKQIKYNDTSTTSFNKKIFIIFECIGADGVVVPDTSTSRCNLNYFFNIRWEDL